MSNYLLAAIGINTVLHSVLKTKRCNDNQKAGFLSRFVARKICLSQFGVSYSACICAVGSWLL